VQVVNPPARVKAASLADWSGRDHLAARLPAL